MPIDQIERAVPTTAAAAIAATVDSRAAAVSRVPGHDLMRTGILPQLCITPAQVWNMTADAAYYRAQRRGFAPGCELDDWLAAEQEILSSLM